MLSRHSWSDLTRKYSNLPTSSFIECVDWGLKTTLKADQPARNVHTTPDHSKNIIVNDLYATLEAHRATNRAAVVRKVDTAPNPETKTILTDAREPEVTTTKESKAQTKATSRPSKDRRSEALSQNDRSFVRPSFLKHKPWLPRSRKYQAQGEQSAKDLAEQSEELKPWDFWPPHSVQHEKLYGSKPKIPKDSLLEYQSRPLYPTGPWKITGQTRPRRPWMHLLPTQTGDGLQT